MRKRIRLHQVRVGMFIEELEGANGAGAITRTAFKLTSIEDVRQVLSSKAISVVIDSDKGVDAQSGQDHVKAFEDALSNRYSSDEIRRARQTVEDTAPHIKALLAQARSTSVVKIEGAITAVEQIMDTSLDNAGALISITKLKGRDEATFLHSFAVSALMISFGRALDLSGSGIRLLGIGGLLHDLGKMALPLEVLNKPGKLDAGEFAIVRSHPQKGHELLSQIDGIDQAVLDICLHHHEKYDGTGYPHGLRGTAIPFVARLAAICDVYDAMTTIRPYKPGWSQAEAVDRMLSSPGHFDPTLLSRFISTMIISGTLQ